MFWEKINGQLKVVLTNLKINTPEFNPRNRGASKDVEGIEQARQLLAEAGALVNEIAAWRPRED